MSRKAQLSQRGMNKANGMFKVMQFALTLLPIYGLGAKHCKDRRGQL